MRKTPNYKAKNALYQKVHYRAEKVKDLEALATTGPSYRKEYEAAKKALEKVRKLVKRTKQRPASRER